MRGSFVAFLISAIFSINITDEIMFSLNQREATMSNLNLAKRDYFLPPLDLIWEGKRYNRVI